MKMRLVILMTVAVLAAALWANAAAAQSACAPRAAVVERLAARYGESPIAAGVTDRNLMIEVLASPDGATRTLIATSPAGVSCFIAAGEGWRALAAEPAAPRT